MVNRICPLPASLRSVWLSMRTKMSSIPAPGLSGARRVRCGVKRPSVVTTDQFQRWLIGPTCMRVKKRSIGASSCVA